MERKSFRRTKTPLWVNSPCQRLCHRLCEAGRFSYGEPPRPLPVWWNFTPPTKQQCGEILGDLEPVYLLFSITSGLIHPDRCCDTNMYVAFLCSRSFFLRCITVDPSPCGNFIQPRTQQRGETLWDLEPVDDLLPITNEFTLSETATQTRGTIHTQPRIYIYWYMYVGPCTWQSIRVQELCESWCGRPGLSVLTSLMVCVDVKQYWTMLTLWSQLVPNMSNDIRRGH